MRKQHVACADVAGNVAVVADDAYDEVVDAGAVVAAANDLQMLLLVALLRMQ